MKNKISFSFMLLMIFLFGFTLTVYADTDEILQYTISVDVNEDATLGMNYHIEWQVLDSFGVGPLNEIKVGIPSLNYMDYEPLSDTIDKMNISSSGGYYAILSLDKDYYDGEIVCVDFRLVQNNMYQMNKFEDGYTVYSFTPGWFDDIRVDNLTIMWNMDKAEKWTPDCLIDNGYLTFNASLSKGEKYTVSVTYPNDAFSFEEYVSDGYESYGESDVVGDIFVLVGSIIGVFSCFMPIIVIIMISRSVSKYLNGANFGGTTKKVTRTKITYYDSCPGCGAIRGDNEKYCQYCGRSFVKSEEVLTEEDMKNQEKEALKFNTDGEYRYSSSPNTFVRVHTVVVPRPVTTSHSSSHHSSCAHSSCACACACACAGGGRAGWTTKDFYKTNLKLRQIK